MKECTFRKMQCNAGHFSRPYGPDEMLPRRCPICNQPYDRRYNRPILCYEDGTVPGENREVPEQEHMEEKHMEQEHMEEEHMTKIEPVPDVSIERTPVPPREMTRRGRVMTADKPAADPFINPVRRQIPQPESFIQHTIRRNHGGKAVLYMEGKKIPIPEGRTCLGREGEWQKYFAMNSLVSRKHAYIEADAMGVIQIQDAESLNGTYIDDGSGRRRLLTGEIVSVKAGDKIWLANQIMVVEEEE